MRVLHVNSGNLFGGIEVVLVTLARHRDLCPVLEPEFALCFPGRTQQELAETGASVHLFGPARVSRPWTIWQARRRLRGLLASRRYDVVVCHGSWSLALFGPEVRRAKLPLVMWLHCPPGLPLNWLDRWASWNAPDLTIVNSDYTLAGVPPLFPGGKAKRIYYPIHFPERISTAQERRTTRAKFDTPEDAVVILQVGRWDPYKGHNSLMSGLGLLASQPDWVCWQVGGVQSALEESYQAVVRETARKAGIADRVRFLGFQDNQTELPRVLAAADVFCQPNIAPEPFGIVFIEALQSGLPVVTTALGGPLEIVNSSCGILVPPNDPKALAGALQQLMENQGLRQQMGQNSVIRARAFSDTGARLQELAGVLQEVAE